MSVYEFVHLSVCLSACQSVCLTVCKLFKFQSSYLEPLGKFQSNMAQSIIAWRKKRFFRWKATFFSKGDTWINLLVKSYLCSSLFFGSQYFLGEQCESRVSCLYLIQILTDPVVTDVSKKLQKSVSQVLLRWAVQEGIGMFTATCKSKE